MRCPLCSGPVHSEDRDFRCEIGHRVGAAELSRSTELELAEALWMAIQALDNEADVLRAIGGERGAQFADDAERQARMLREFAHQHAPRVNDAAEGSGADSAQ
jgi:hypothetical protein